MLKTTQIAEKEPKLNENLQHLKQQFVTILIIKPPEFIL